MELARSGHGANARQLQAEAAARADNIVHQFFVKCGYSGGVCGLSARQHHRVNIAKPARKRGGKARKSAGASTQINMEHNHRAVRKKSQSACAERNVSQRDYDKLAEHTRLDSRPWQ